MPVNERNAAMSKIQAAVERICSKGVVAVVRAKSSAQIIDVTKALLAGGVDCIEITMTTPNALAVISDCRKALPVAMIGVGSVLDGATAAKAIAAWCSSSSRRCSTPTSLRRPTPPSCPSFQAR